MFFLWILLGKFIWKSSNYLLNLISVLYLFFGVKVFIFLKVFEFFLIIVFGSFFINVNDLIMKENWF